MIMIYPSEITKKWPHRPLSEVVDFLDSKRKPITQKDRVPGPYPYYGANGQQDSVADYIFDEPLVLLAEDGGHFGDADKTIAYQVEGKCWVNNHAHVLRPKKDVDIRYICRHLERYDVTPFITGSTRGKLTKTAANNIPIALPPLEEQRRIAAILDKADGVRRKRKEAIRLTEELLKSTFLEMFGDSERNFREHCGQDCFLPLEKCIERFIDYRGKTPTKANSGVPLITAKIIKNGRIQPPNEFIARENYDSWMRRGLPELGDVLFTTEAPLGEVAQVDDPDIALAQRVLLMRGKSNILDNTYLFGTLQSSFVRDQIERRSTGSTVKGIRQKELRKVVIPIPPIFLQRKYASFAVSQQKCTDRQKLLFKESENLFNALCKRAFRGEL
ncbi:restriction endonuclease subunit S [Microcystis aeruginosa CS-564/01]|uniref:restriction endonuclease subunit S n=1 Tax=Microcystis aeruginosa TaxID=1126 RepID=UPI00232C9BA5|nr:restriction endonuclease subunit S [Microcystis aeruginosa]MDB9424032.1 restriction endonuclease subunit S [Microcystis aeruginosa CS-564/01]